MRRTPSTNDRPGRGVRCAGAIGAHAAAGCSTSRTSAGVSSGSGWNSVGVSPPYSTAHGSMRTV